ncbi:MAG: aminotransferase class V-fold PLP-dependent enzyme, partial [Lachnospiraceae bacterium]|nr:aminotransferase class V-fold PLP-dependent enzyme [Lachnospiraceae bacterium]
KRFYDGVKEIPEIRFYGDYGDWEKRTAIVALNLGDEDSAFVSDALAVDYGIATRPGAHCAPLMHESFGTVNQGIVRFSFSYFNTEEEADAAIHAMRELAAGM